MEVLFRIVNFENGEVAEVSALPENRNYALKWFYKRALSWARDNVRHGLIGIDDVRKIRHRKRGVHLYALKDGIPAYRIDLT